MKKLILSVVAVSMLATGACFAESLSSAMAAAIGGEAVSSHSPGVAKPAAGYSYTQPPQDKGLALWKAVSACLVGRPGLEALDGAIARASK